MNMNGEMSPAMKAFLSQKAAVQTEEPECDVEREFTRQSACAAHEPEVEDREDLELLQTHLKDAVSCYGGKLFRGWDEYGNPIIRFAVKGMSAEDVKNAEEHYNRVGRMSAIGLAHRTSNPPMRVKDYTVFDFEIIGDEFTLREMQNMGKPFKRDPEMVFRVLVEFLCRYRTQLANIRRPYQALNCLTMETVIFGKDNHLKVIPLYTRGTDYPVEIPREVTTAEGADERSDLFAAAYIAVEIYSAGRPDRKLVEPDSKVISDCLKGIRDCRPDLDKVQAMLVDCNVAHHVQDADRPFCDYDGNDTRSGERIIASARKAGGFMVSVMGKLKEWAAPIADLEEEETEDQLDGTHRLGQNFYSGDYSDVQESPNGTFCKREG